MTKRALIALIVIVVAGAAVRLHYVDQPMRVDESLTVISYVLQGGRAVLTNLDQPNNHIYHSLSIYIVWKATGALSPVLIRLPVLLAGIAAIPMTYLAGRAFLRSEGALVAAALVAGSPMLILYSTNARGYALVTLFMLVYLWAAARIRDGDDPWWVWALSIGTAALAVYTIVTAVYALGGIALWLLLSLVFESERPEWSQVGRFIAAMAGAALIAGLLYLPVELFGSGLGELIADARRYGTAGEGNFLPTVRLRLGEAWQLWTAGGMLPVVTAMLAAAVVATFWSKRVTGRAVPLAACVLGWVAALIVIQQGFAFPRVWQFLFPFLAIVSAGTIWFLLERVTPQHAQWALVGLSSALVVGLLAANLATNYVLADEETGVYPSAERLALQSAEHLSEGDLLLVYNDAEAQVLFYQAMQGIEGVQTVFYGPWRDLALQSDDVACRRIVVAGDGQGDFESIYTWFTPATEDVFRAIGEPAFLDTVVRSDLYALQAPCE
ncbi:MAG: hypothetical protein ACFB51_00225 [Anaerolineae bacterium]